MDNNINEEALFHPYLYLEDIRPALQSPFPFGDSVWATNTNVMLRVSKERLDGDYPVVEGCPNPHASLEGCKPNFGGTLTIEKLKQALAKCPQVKEVVTIVPEHACAECGGEGEVDWEYTTKDGLRYCQEFECPMCEGAGIISAKRMATGRDIPSSHYLLKVNGVLIQAQNIQKMVDTMELLGSETAVHIVRQYDNRVNVFCIDAGIDFICMGRTSWHGEVGAELKSTNV